MYPRPYGIYHKKGLIKATILIYIHCYFRGDESDYSEDAPYGENRSDDGSTGSVSKTSVTEKKSNDVPVMTKYVPDTSVELFGTANDQVRTKDLYRIISKI